MNIENQLIEMARADPPMLTATKLLGVLAAVVDRMDSDERVRTGWHLIDLATRIDPDVKLRYVH